MWFQCCSCSLWSVLTPLARGAFKAKSTSADLGPGLLAGGPSTREPWERVLRVPQRTQTRGRGQNQAREKPLFLPGDGAWLASLVVTEQRGSFSHLKRVKVWCIPCCVAWEAVLSLGLGLTRRKVSNGRDPPGCPRTVVLNLRVATPLGVTYQRFAS